MWYSVIKRFYDNGHPAYTIEALKMFVVARMITSEEYEQIME
ncbi:XkdX family protein [Paenibacillus lautus]